MHWLSYNILPHASLRNGEMQGERECIYRFCKKLLNSPQGKRVLMVAVLNRLKNTELLVAFGQESVVLAAEVEKLENCLHHGVKLLEVSTLSCARQIVCVIHFSTVITSCCNETFGEVGRFTR